MTISEHLSLKNSGLICNATMNHIEKKNPIFCLHVFVVVVIVVKVVRGQHKSDNVNLVKTISQERNRACMMFDYIQCKKPIVFCGGQRSTEVNLHVKNFLTHNFQECKLGLISYVLYNQLDSCKDKNHTCFGVDRSSTEDNYRSKCENLLNKR